MFTHNFQVQILSAGSGKGTFQAIKAERGITLLQLAITLEPGEI
jgi:hypothetical protein